MRACGFVDADDGEGGRRGSVVLKEYSKDRKGTNA